MFCSSWCAVYLKEEANLILVSNSQGGIWSILVTFFSLESYRWLSENPATTTVALLSQISQQLDDQNTRSSGSSTPTFRPAASIIRINCFWFLSLIMTITCTVIGLLCKQWLDEHCRRTHTRTHMETLALQHLRIESLERWGVPYIITRLPVLLQLALLLFLVGLLELFWLSNAILFAIGLAAIGLIFLFYSATTYLSAIQILRHALKSQPYNDSPAATLSHLRSLGSVCPYKSPQSWAVFSVMRSFLQTSFVKHVLYRLFRGRLSFGTFQDALDRNLNTIVRWSSFDLEVVRTFEGMKNAPSFHGIKGLQQLLRTFRDTESIPHLANILNSLPSTLTSLVTSTAFDDWKLPLWKKLQRNDIEQALKDPITFFPTERSEAGLDPYGKDHFGPSPQSPAFTQLFYYLSSWGNNDFDWKSRYEMTELLYRTEIPLRARMPFVVPFYELEKLLCSELNDPTTHGTSSRDNSERIYERGIAIEFLHFYELGWTVASSLLDSGHHDKLALVKAVTDHLLLYESDLNPASSMLLTSSHGLEFLSFLDDRIKKERLNENGDWIFANIMPRWSRASQRAIHRHSSELKQWDKTNEIAEAYKQKDAGKGKEHNELAFARYPKIEPYPPAPSLMTPPRRSREYIVEYPLTTGNALSSPDSSLRPSDYYNPIVRELIPHADDQSSARFRQPRSQIIRYPSPVLSEESEARPIRRPPSSVLYKPETFTREAAPPSWYRHTPSYDGPKTDPPPRIVIPSTSYASVPVSAKAESEIQVFSSGEDYARMASPSPTRSLRPPPWVESEGKWHHADAASESDEGPPSPSVSVSESISPEVTIIRRPLPTIPPPPTPPQHSWYRRRSPSYDRIPVVPLSSVPPSSFRSGSAAAMIDPEVSSNEDIQISISPPTRPSPPSTPISARDDEGFLSPTELGPRHTV
ncbi:hypothetical protein E1B28_012952 [Marasmius oreades]|uniref:DUF6535 domain-containing protein n=1 Tax=Marasmius oreades TaxID=181124 RepID=A0A9P7RTA6_9AGAR|nr:uncharacterized protein E1B28_012952 [Marasmius oreades]KAG7089003.1 hypothetical protein E1B28_012952 [Marasmius oreades]